MGLGRNPVLRQANLVVAALALAGASIGLPAPAAAGSFKINPVQITLPTDRQAASLKITNSDAAPVSIRVTALAWSQVDGRDVYTPTSNVITSPPIFTIAAGKTQLLRIGLKSRGDAAAYRLLVEEIPREQPADGQIKVLLRLNLPLYLLPKGGGKADLSWSAWRDASGDLFVEGRNRGLLHSQVLELSADQSGRRSILSKQMGVVLPGSARQWKIGSRADLKVGAPLLLSIRSPTSETRTQLVLEQR